MGAHDAGRPAQQARRVPTSPWGPGMITCAQERLLELPSGTLAFVTAERADAALLTAHGALPTAPGLSATVPDARSPLALVFALGRGPRTVQVARVTRGREPAGLMVWLDPDAELDDGRTVADATLRFIDAGWFPVDSAPLLIGDPATFAGGAHGAGLAEPVSIRRIAWNGYGGLFPSFVVLAGGEPVGIYLVAGDLEPVYPPRAQIDRPPWVEGAEAFNGVDLRGRDLSGRDLRGRDLSRSDLRGTNLAGADLTRATLIDCLASGAILTEATLTQAELAGAWLQDADLSGARLGHAALERADLSGARLPGAILRGAGLEGACLRGADLRGADLREANLESADLEGADLSDADVTGARLST